jgi:hypothetical protein
VWHRLQPLRAAFLLAFAAFAQVADNTPARIDIAAPESILVGNSARLVATVRDSNGRVIPNAPIAWQSDNPPFFPIDSQGVLQALNLGPTRITASSGNARRSVTVRGAAFRIEIDPPSATLQIGDRQKFTARLLDANRQPFAPDPNTGARIDWFVLNAAGVVVRSLAPDANGFVNASLTGRFIVQARLGELRATAALQVDPRPGYRLRRVFSNDPIPGPHTLFNMAGAAVFNQAGQFAVTVNLGGWSRQVLLWDNGQVRPVLSAGETDTAELVTDYRFRGPPFLDSTQIGGITSRGEVLLCCKDLILGQPGDARAVLRESTWLGTAESFGRFSTGRRSVNDAGEVAFTARSFRYAGSTQNLWGVFKILRNRLTIIWTSDQPLEGLNGPALASNPMIDGQGTVYFTAADGVANALYVSNGGEAPRRLIGSGDLVSERSVVRLGLDLNAAMVNEAGDLAVWITLPGSRGTVVRIRAGGAPEVLDNTYGAAGSVFAMNASGAVLFAAEGGLHLWEAESSRTLLPPNAPAPDGGTITSIESAGITAGGEVLAHVRTSIGAIMIFKLDGPVYLKTGDLVDAAAPAHFTVESLVPGTNRLRLSFELSLFDVQPARLEPVIVQGAPPHGGLNPGTGFIDAGSQGIYFANPNRVFRWTESGETAVAAIQGNIQRFAVNRQGQGVIVSNPRLYRFDGTNISLLADNTTEAPEGGSFTSWSEVAIDERGRVLALAATSNGLSGLFLYDGSWRAALILGRFRMTGASLPVSHVVRIRSAGDRFFALLTAEGGEASYSLIASLDQAEWKTEVNSLDPMPAGVASPVGNIFTFEVNARGEIVFKPAQGGLTEAVLVRSESGLNVVTYTPYAADGAYLKRIHSVTIQDDGVVYFTGFDQAGRYCVMQGEPL